MKPKPLIIIGLAGLAIVALLVFTLFELKKVPDVQWQETYHYASKQPYGCWMLHALISERFSGVPVVRHLEDTLLSDIESSDHLYVYISSSLVLDRVASQALVDFANRGNDVLIITGALNLDLEDIEPFEWNKTGLYDSSVTVNYDWDTTTTYTFNYFSGDLDQSVPTYFAALSDAMAYDQMHTIVGVADDSLVIFDQWNLAKGRIFLHTIPAMFSNIAAKQTFYRDHFNMIFSVFTPKMVILDHASWRAGSDSASESPLQFILANKYLRLAYFLLLFTVLSFILFKSKRRQRVIPTLESNVNTSLEYVKTLSSLFQQQNQHKKLIHHLEMIFYHHLKRRYFLERTDAQFVTNLVRKSKVDREEVMALLDEFDRAHKKLNVGDDHLVTLYQRLDSFYHKCK